MEGSQRFGFFLLVLFFSGSVVLMAAHELRKKTMREGAGSRSDAKELIRELRGERVAGKEDAYVDEQEMKERGADGSLRNSDKRRLNSLLRSIIPSDPEP